MVEANRGEQAQTITAKLSCRTGRVEVSGDAKQTRKRRCDSDSGRLKDCQQARLVK